jgi:uncharacterized membrane protein
MRAASKRQRKTSPATIWAMAALNLIVAPLNIYASLHAPTPSPIWVIASFAAAAAMIWAFVVMIGAHLAKPRAPALIDLQALVPTP